MRLFLLLAAFSTLFSFPICAAATPSDADPEIVEEDAEYDEDILDEDMELINDLAAADETDASGSDQDYQTSVLSYLDLIAGGIGVATDSDAEPETDPDDTEESIEINALASPVSLLLEGEESFINCLRYDVTVDGTEYTLLFSPSYIDQIFVDSSGNLWNMGTSQISGRVLTDGFDPYATEGTLVYLGACLGNNFSANYNYGSPNYFREYYWSSSRLTYSDTYVQILVNDVHHPFLVGDTLMYILIFLVGGGVLLCWLNRFRHY